MREIFKQKSTEHWKRYWRDKKIFSKVKLKPYQKCVFKYLEKEVKSNPNLKILNAGSGVDTVSLILKEKYPTVDLCLLDISPECLKNGSKTGSW